MGNKMAELAVILSEMDKIRKAVWFTARVGDPWILTMFIWCCDSDAFRRVQRIWTEADFRIVRGCSASMTKGVSGSDVETMSVLPACLQVMHRRHRSFVIERASYTLTGKSSPMCIVRGLSEVAMICASAVDPNHKMMMRFTQDPTLVSMLIGFATLHEQVFVTAAMRLQVQLKGESFATVVGEVTTCDMQMVLRVAESMGVMSPAIDTFGVSGHFNLVGTCDNNLACAYCGKENATNVCSRCKSVRYCDSKCQKKHWKLAHKVKCR